MKLTDGQLNVIYSLGASVVILGALFKITHWPLPFGITGNLVLGIGLVSEAIVFVLYAFNPPGVELPWERVYPELLDANATPGTGRARDEAKKVQVDALDASLSEKLDKMLADAKIDASLFDRLKTGMDKFSASVEQINKTVDITGASQRYNDQLSTAASNLENINALYSLQLSRNESQSAAQQSFLENLQKTASQSQKFNDELNGLSASVSNLNKVYGGMLSAMKG